MSAWNLWRFLLRRAARARGFIDPFEFLARLRQFSQPSEVQEPIELIRAGVVFHARGLINTKVLQNNLDWIWPYWVVRQFDPGDPSFLPRAFSFSHVNLTHRNWTAVGLPGMTEFPVVDPRGLVTPREDGWSLDWWFVPADGPPLLPSRTRHATQQLSLDSGLEVITRFEADGVQLATSASVAPLLAPSDPPALRLTATVRSRLPGHLVLALRPANPEGVRFIDTIHLDPTELVINRRHTLRLETPPLHLAASVYAEGDVFAHLETARAAGETITCPAGLATAAALYAVEAEREVTATAILPLPMPGTSSATTARPARPAAATHGLTTDTPFGLWSEALAPTPQLTIPEPQWSFLHDAALRTLVLLSGDEIVPGPYTYRRFWFRDACLMAHALLAANLSERVRHALIRFPARQRHDGYFHSQEGEWDANGQVLWLADRYEELSGDRLSPALVDSLERGARWIVKTRAKGKGLYAGLLPAGFSAEHLGPNDHYYWDDFWGVAGLKAAAALARRRLNRDAALHWTEEATAFLVDLQRSLTGLPGTVAEHGIPAAPRRRLDAGAIGSMVADYPLLLDEVGTDRLLRTADWLWQHCRHRGGFFQDMIHSGINAYLTLALAQTFLRAGDERWHGLVRAVADIASPTGQWPEAVHPITGGGCMGDGQHGWAAAEWVLMMRALFVREEADHLVLGAGLRPEWFAQADRLAYGPTATRWGKVTVKFRRTNGRWSWHLEGDWHGPPPRVRVLAPGFVPAWSDSATSPMPLTPTS